MSLQLRILVFLSIDSKVVGLDSCLDGHREFQSVGGSDWWRSVGYISGSPLFSDGAPNPDLCPGAGSSDWH